MTTRLDSYSWRGVGQHPKFTIRHIATPTCQTCLGSTIGEHGEQCRACAGNGFVTMGDKREMSPRERYERFGRAR